MAYNEIVAEFGTRCAVYTAKQTKNARVMKTTKLFLSIALVALTIAAFGNYNSSIETVYESELSL